MDPGYYVTQALTGHGNFAGKLYSFGLVETSDCMCGLPETSEHILFECEHYSEYRVELKEKLKSARIDWPPDKRFLMGEEIFPIYAKYITSALKAKEFLEEI